MTRSAAFKRSKFAVASPVGVNGWNDSASQPKVVRLSLRPRMEEGNDRTRRVHRTEIRTLEAVADQAGIRQIFGDSFAAMLPADDVIDLVHETGILFMDETILAPETRTTDNLGTKFRGDSQ